MRAYGVSHSAIRSQHCQRILDSALSEAVDNNEQPIESIASQRLFHELEKGLEGLQSGIVQQNATIDRHRLLMAINRCRIAQKFPDALLGLKALPQAQADALKETYEIQHVPELKRRSMGAPTLRFETLDDVTSGTTAFFEQWPIARRIVPALLAFLLILIVYQFAK